MEELIDIILSNCVCLWFHYSWKAAGMAAGAGSFSSKPEAERELEEG